MKFSVKKILLIAWTLLIFFLISFPMPEYEGDVVTLYDKYVHVLMFGIFSFLLALNLITKFKLQKVILFSAAAGILYSALAEYIQIYIPGRTVSEYDFLAGIIGVFIADIVFYIYARKKV